MVARVGFVPSANHGGSCVTTHIDTFGRNAFVGDSIVLNERLEITIATATHGSANVPLTPDPSGDSTACKTNVLDDVTRQKYCIELG